MSLNESIQQFCSYLRNQKNYSGNTVDSYQNDLTGLAGYLNSAYDADDLTSVSVQILRSWLSNLKENNIQSRSVNRKLSAVRSFYKYLMKTGVCDSNPAADISSLKTDKKLPVFLEPAQIAPLLNRDFFPSGFEGDTDFLIINMFYDTGMRVSEVANLEENDLLFLAGAIRVVGKGNKQRNIPLGPELRTLISDYIAEKKRLFGSPNTVLLVDEANLPLNRIDIYKRVHRMLAEVTTIRKKSPHVLRHTFATTLSNNGAPIGAIKDLLGHSSLAATQVYTHTGIARLKEIYKKSHPKS